MIGNGHAGFGRAASEKDPQGHLADVVPRHAAIPVRSRGNGPGTGSRSDARMASALRRCAVVLRLVAHPRTPARRRGAQTTTSRRMARAVHRHRSVRELGGGRRGRLRRRLSVRASMPLTYERGRLTACERERLRSPRRFCHCVRRGGATPRARGRLSAAVRRTEAQIPGRRRSRPRRRRDYRNQWGSHREHWAPPDARPVAKRARELRDRPRSQQSSPAPMADGCITPERAVWRPPGRLLLDYGWSHPSSGRRAAAASAGAVGVVGSARGAWTARQSWPDWSGFLSPPHRSVHAVLPHTALRRSSPSAFGSFPSPGPVGPGRDDGSGEVDQAHAVRRVVRDDPPAVGA